MSQPNSKLLHPVDLRQAIQNRVKPMFVLRKSIMHFARNSKKHVFHTHFCLFQALADFCASYFVDVTAQTKYLQPVIARKLYNAIIRHILLICVLVYQIHRTTMLCWPKWYALSSSPHASHVCLDVRELPSHLNERLRHEASSIGRIIWDSKAFLLL